MNDGRIRELWGRKIDVVKEGLDQAQVAKFIDELIAQRGILLEQINTLLSYIRLSKGMVIKDDELTVSSEQQAENKIGRIVTETGQGIQPEVKTTELEQATPLLPLEAVKASEVGGEKPALYQGEVELAILPPVNPVGLLQFQRTLRDSFQLNIMSTDGSPSKGSLITVLLGEPQPLLQGLKQIPEVKEAAEEPDTSTQIRGGLPSLFKSNQKKRIWITLGKG